MDLEGVEEKKQTVCRDSKFHLSESILVAQLRYAAKLNLRTASEAVMGTSSIIRRHKTHFAQRFRAIIGYCRSCLRLRKRYTELVIVLSLQCSR